MTQTCPACGHDAQGRFCAHCGAGLDAEVSCTECGNQLPRGGRFCNQCGTATPATRAAAAAAAASTPPAAPGGNLPWIITGAALVALLAVLLLPQLNQDEPATAPVAQAPFAGGGAGAPAGDARSVDLSSMTPREAADRLFNRVMQAVSSGDSAQARTFLPMALSAYDRVPDLDNDGHYHVAVLQMVGGDLPAARARADSILSDEPNHLFGLFTAAQAEQALGNQQAGRELYQRFLQNFDSESARKLPEYADHQQLLPSMQQEARKAVGE